MASLPAPFRLYPGLNRRQRSKWPITSGVNESIIFNCASRYWIKYAESWASVGIASGFFGGGISSRDADADEDEDEDEDEHEVGWVWWVWTIVLPMVFSVQCSILLKYVERSKSIDTPAT